MELCLMNYLNYHICNLCHHPPLCNYSTHCRLTASPVSRLVCCLLGYLVLLYSYAIHYLDGNVYLSCYCFDLKLYKYWGLPLLVPLEFCMRLYKNCGNAPWGISAYKLTYTPRFYTGFTWCMLHFFSLPSFVVGRTVLSFRTFATQWS